MKKAIILLSGGLDSAALLAHLLEDRDSGDLISLSLIYGQKHQKEVKAAVDIARYYGVKHIVKEIPNIFAGAGSTLIDLDKSNPELTYQQLQDAYGVSPTYVPFRNGILLSLAAALALVEGAEEVYYGAHADDSHNYAYPDCTPEFIEAMGRAINVGTYFKVALFAPWSMKTKQEIVFVGHKLNTPFELTWSCYNGREKACGKCPTCINRIEAFKQNNLTDPIPYEIEVEW
ncbi:7-cyano-7-deazaguanine synthase QueC [Pelotomaculum terephthalicicum JT]|uniref:7-cyano-7-deazaguanine synthase QueC n=1 Tax=Pelotomaculum terephthalicicum TaxID=206393 RepID=UPI001F042639|nr:7-cyano-7-deazaguanine synthase QueC [Pelotomaculum terephthalicicum]MCG9969921.1 7-cyano-7-deazaguanine synthase QueC [Pelotomaculum terephthalicicum JT]